MGDQAGLVLWRADSFADLVTDHETAYCGGVGGCGAGVRAAVPTCLLPPHPLPRGSITHERARNVGFPSETRGRQSEHGAEPSDLGEG